MLTLTDGAAVPLDHKKGRRPHVAEGAYLPEQVQIAIQGLLLREAGYTCVEGALWYVESRERVPVPLTDELIAAALAAASELRLAAAARRIPPPLDNSPKCTRCSLLPICLPDEVNLFRTGAVPRTPPPPADAALPLYVQTPGARIGRSGEVLVITVDGETDRRVPLGEVSELVLAGPVGLTTPALHEAVRREIPYCLDEFRLLVPHQYLAVTDRAAPLRAARNTRRPGIQRAPCASHASWWARRSATSAPSSAVIGVAKPIRVRR